MLDMSSEIPQAWVRFIRSSAELTARMDRRLATEHDLSLRGYEVLLALHGAPGRRMRRVDLAGKIFLTQSGVTRLLAGLERDGLVEKVPGEEDRRVTYAQLTEAGRRRFTAAARTHRADIAEQFTARLSARDLAALDRALSKLPGGGGGSWRDDG